MKKFSFKKYLTLNELVDFLSIFFGEDLSKADVLGFCMDRALVPSVLITSTIYGLEIKPITESEIRREKIRIPLSGVYEDVWFERCIRFDDGRLFDEKEWVHHNMDFLKGIYDLPMQGGEVFLIEDLYFSEIQHDGYSSQMCLDGVVLQDANGSFFKIMDRMNNAKQGESCNWFYFPYSNIPETCMLVFRMENINKFTESSSSFIAEKNSLDSKKSYDGLSDQETNITTLKAIGFMAELLAQDKTNFRRGDNVNAKAIGDAVAARAKIRFGDDVRGFDSFNRKISEGLKALEKKEKK